MYIPTAQADTALSPEWDHGFDEAFAELISSDADLVQAEFEALIGACWNDPPASPPPPARSTAEPAQPRPEPRSCDTRSADAAEHIPRPAIDNQRSPP